LARSGFGRRVTGVQSVRTSSNGHGPRLLTIGEVARRSGFTVKALRFYDGHGILPPCRRQPTGYRLYSESDLHRLEFIRQAKALGLTLDAIRDLVEAARVPGAARVRPRLLRMLNERIAQTAHQITTLTALRAELERRRRIVAAPRGEEGGRGYCTCLHGGQAHVGPGRPEEKTRWNRLQAKTDPIR
jgi:MerR family transcriptional regulator, copper efflux regulator